MIIIDLCGTFFYDRQKAQQQTAIFVLLKTIYMKKVLLILLLFATKQSFSQGNSQQFPFKILELNHGIGKPKDPKPTNSKDSAAAKNKPSEPFKVIKTTDSIPAKLNTTFGVEFKITGKDTADIHYTREWIYPVPMKENDGRKYRATKNTATISSRQNGISDYTFYEPFCLLKGKWTLNIYVENQLLYTRVFIVY